MSRIPAGYQYNPCRGLLRHSWDEITSDWAIPDHLAGVPFTARCVRCGAERRDLYGTNTGELVSRRYMYPEGYHIDTEDGLPNIYDFRLDWIRSMTKQMRKKRKT